MYFTLRPFRRPYSIRQNAKLNLVFHFSSRLGLSSLFLRLFLHQLGHLRLQLGQCLCLLLDPFLAVPKLLEALVLHLCIVSLLSLGHCCLKLLVCPYYLLLNQTDLVLQVISFFLPKFSLPDQSCLSFSLLQRQPPLLPELSSFSSSPLLIPAGTWRWPPSLHSSWRW